MPKVFMWMSNLLPLAIDEIPHMLPNDLRERAEDMSFLQKWEDKIPEKTKLEGKPFNLKAGA